MTNKTAWPPGATEGDAHDLEASRELVEKATDAKVPESPELDLYADQISLNGKNLEIPRMSDEMLRTFIQAFLGGQIFTSMQIKNPSDVVLVFLPLALGALSGYRPEGFENLGVIYEFHNAALSRGVNGMPVFPSCRLMHKLDWARAVKVINRELDRQAAMELPPDDPTEET